MGNNVKKPKSPKIEVYVKQPKYYDKFRCIGGECPGNCCEKNWGIEWSNGDVEYLKANCPEDMLEIAEKAFEPSERGTYLVAMQDNRCPFLTEDKFCMIQRRMGAEYFANVCLYYPRHIMGYGDRALRHCYMSCCAVLDLICDEEDSMELVYKKERVPQDRMNDKYSLRGKMPEIEYGVLFFDFFYQLISSNFQRGGVDHSVIAGAMAAESMTGCIGAKAYGQLPELTESLKKRFEQPLEINMDVNAVDNYLFKIETLVEIINNFANYPIVKNLFNEDGSVNLEMYLFARKRFEDYCAEKPWVMRNIALNMLFECGVPFRRPDMTVFENYSYFAAIYAVVKMIGICIGTVTEDIDKRFRANLCSASPRLFQNTDHIMEVVDILKKRNCLSVPMLALLIKY